MTARFHLTLAAALLCACSGKVSPSDDAGVVDANADASDATFTPHCDGDCLAPPWGWIYVGYSPDGGACPAGYGDGTDLIVSATGAPASCSCSCGAPLNQPSCTPPKFFDIYVWDDAACKTQTLAHSYFGTSPACVPAPGSYSSSSPIGVQLSVYSYGVTSVLCPSPVQSSTVPPPSVLSQGRECRVTDPFEGCRPGESCVPAAAAPFGRCIETFDDVPCPANFPNRFMGWNGFSDTRGCAPCVCNGLATCISDVTFYSDDACSVPLMTLPTDYNTYDKCHPMGSTSLSFAAFTYTPPVDQPTCVVQPGATPPPTGEVTKLSPRTICCP